MLHLGQLRDKKALISMKTLRKCRNMMEFTQYCTNIVGHFEWFFMEILTFSCFLYQYVGLWDINLPMHLRL